MREGSKEKPDRFGRLVRQMALGEVIRISHEGRLVGLVELDGFKGDKANMLFVFDRSFKIDRPKDQEDAHG